MREQNQQSSQAKNQNIQPDASASQVRLLCCEDWEKPDFNELDLCMEVTAYVYHWQ
jgi:coenzyme PQQ precursor peptide PqqA